MLVPADYGAYFLASTVVLFGALLGSFGLNQALVRFVAAAIGLNQAARARALMLRILALGLTGSLIVAAVYYLAGERLLALFLDMPALVGVTGLVALWIAATAWQRLIAEGFRGLHDIRNATWFGGLFSSTLAVGALLMLWRTQGQVSLSSVLACVLLAATASAVWGGWRLARKILILPSVRTAPSSHEIWRAAWPLLFTNLTLFVLTQIDLWILAAFRPAEEVAQYGAASRLALMTMVVTSILYSVLPPLIARQYARREKHQLERILRAGATLTGLISLPIFALFIGAPRWTLEIVYGGFYGGADVVLTLLAWGLYINVITGMRGNVLLMAGHERTELIITLVSATLNVVLCILGAAYAGMSGVALAAMIAMITQCLLEELAVRYRLGIWTHASLRSLGDIKRLFGFRAARAVSP
jgi:O-antigen/teichoic acid export membrane protein